MIALPNDVLGGAELYLKNIALHYLSERYQVHVLFLKEKITGSWETIDSSNLFLYYTNAISEKAGLFPFIYNVIKKVHNRKFEYVYTSHVHVTGFVGILIKMKLITTNNFVARESTTIFNRFSGLKLLMFRLHYKLGYSQVDVLICQTDWMKAQLVKNEPQLENKVKVIPNPIRLGEQQDNIDIPYKPYLVSAGRLITEKGFDILIISFSLILKTIPNLNLVILGDGPDGEKLRKIALQHNISDKVKLIGFQSNVLPYFANAEACVVSSRIEGFPNVLLQMMSQNNKVISTKCAGDVDQIKGLYISEVNNIESLKDSILAALKDTSNNRNFFDEYLRERSVEKFISKLYVALSELS